MEDRDTYWEHQLEFEVAALRQDVQHLTQKLERSNYARCEDQSEIARHHAALAQISGLASDALPLLHSLVYAAPEQDDMLDDVHAIIRNIRNIAG